MSATRHIPYAGSFLLAAILALTPAAMAQQGWPNYGHDPGPADYSPLHQITTKNVSQLRQAWVYHYGAGDSKGGFLGLDYRFEVTPLVINDVMYISTPTAPKRQPSLKSAIVALQPETGKVIWKYESPANIHGRGVAYWPGGHGTDPRIFFATDGGYLSAVDAKTGELVISFGVDGRVDAYAGVAGPDVSPVWRTRYTVPNPVTIYRDLVITGARPGELGPPGPRGDIRAWDARSGALVWTFHTVPQPGDANHDTWPGDSWKDRTGVNMWSVMTLDSNRGILFAGLGSASPDAEGAGRPGPDLYSDSLVALDAATGKLLWYHQLVHHDLWDLDLSTPPALVTVKKDGKTIPAVAQTGKLGYVFFFNRVNGDPIYPIVETPMPTSDVANNPAWPTQPIPSTPPHLGPISMTRADLDTVTPQLAAYCTKVWNTSHPASLGPYTPALTNEATISFQGGLSSVNWNHPSFDPKLGYLFINFSNNGGMRSPQKRFGTAFSLNGVPCYAPPWGELAAVNVNTGKIAWTTPLGNWTSLGAQGIGRGAFNLGGNIATAAGVIFVAATADHTFRAFDAETGKQLWATEMPAGGHATPITYMGHNGKQYVVVVAAGGTAIERGGELSDALMAFALP